MFVKPSNTNPAALRKARWEAEQKARNEEAHRKVLDSLGKKG